MDRDVASNTFPTGLKTQFAMRHGSLAMRTAMALQAEFAAFPPYQKIAIHTAMWIMAGNAAIDRSRRVRMQEGTAFVGVTRNAGLRRLVEQAGMVGRTMRIMAIRTLQEAFS
jgi:hypothetical protein